MGVREGLLDSFGVRLPSVVGVVGARMISGTVVTLPCCGFIAIPETLCTEMLGFEFMRFNFCRCTSSAFILVILLTCFFVIGFLGTRELILTDLLTIDPAEAVRGLRPAGCLISPQAPTLDTLNSPSMKLTSVTECLLAYGEIKSLTSDVSLLPMLARLPIIEFLF